MSKRIENYFPKVLEKVEKEFKKEISDKGIPSVYKGYVSTFGAMIIQNGLLPALAFFEKKDESGEGERERIVKIIKEILKHEETKLNIGEEKLCHILSKSVKENKISMEKLKTIEYKILDISVAIKLSLRTFVEKKGD